MRISYYFGPLLFCFLTICSSDGESSEKANSTEEKYGIASAAINNAYSRNEETALSKVLLQIANATHGENERYNNYMNAPIGKTDDNGEMKASNAAAINALTGGYDYSNGATGWDGRDIAGKNNSHKYGLNITNPAHDLYNLGDRPYTKKVNSSFYARQTTAAYGQTIFMRIHPDFIKGGGGRY